MLQQYFIYGLCENNCQIQRKSSRFEKINNHDLLKNNPDFKLILKNYKFSGIKEKAQEALLHILFNDWPIEISPAIFSAQSLLKKQAHGKRVATLLFEDHQRKNNVLGKKNAFYFLLHDLEHAHNFLADSKSYQIQVSTFKFLYHLYRQQFFDFCETGEMKTRFEYLVSDMNTHWAHTLIYLKSIMNTEQTNQLISLLNCKEEVNVAFSHFFFEKTQAKDFEIIENFLLTL